MSKVFTIKYFSRLAWRELNKNGRRSLRHLKGNEKVKYFVEQKAL